MSLACGGREPARTSSRSIMATSATSSATLVEAGARVTVVPAHRELRRDHGARARRLLPVERAGRSGGDRRICGAGDPGRCWRPKKPLFGICLGHQMLALAVGGRTSKMFQGHRGANHPVKRLADGRVEITSMNHGFAVERERLAGQCARDARVAVRRQQLRDRADRPPGVQRAISPRGEPGAAGQLLSVREVRRDDGQVRMRCTDAADDRGQQHGSADLHVACSDSGSECGDRGDDLSMHAMRSHWRRSTLDRLLKFRADLRLDPGREREEDGQDLLVPERSRTARPSSGPSDQTPTLCGSQECLALGAMAQGRVIDLKSPD